jgi:surface antigen
MTVTAKHAALVVALALGGCAASAAPKESDGGGLSGLLPFASSSSRPAAKTPSGAPIPGELARGFDEKDRSLFTDAQVEALERGAAGAAKEWQNPVSGHGGTITPGPTYSVNQYSCRDYSQRIVMGEKSEVVRATACRQPDGSWRPIS